ncbi:MAG: hypothetical protein GY852_00800, partial [bacterium]|nr:hypothetical protein [bacterium]
MKIFYVSILLALLTASDAVAKYRNAAFSGKTVAFIDFDIFLEPDTLSEKLLSLPAGTEIKIISRTEYGFTRNNFI